VKKVERSNRWTFRDIFKFKILAFFFSTLQSESFFLRRNA
jgi:hypothetical protein